MPFKTWSVGEEVLASDFNPYVQQQVVARFATAAARTAAITAPVLSQLTTLDTAPGIVQYWNGSAWVNVGSGAEIAYAQVTASVPLTNQSAASSHLVVDGGTQTYDGSPIVVEFFSPNVLTPLGGATHLTLFDGATILAELALIGINTNQVSVPVFCRQRLSPSVGTHNYRVGAWVSGGNGTVNASSGTGGSMLPAFIRITRA